MMEGREKQYRNGNWTFEVLMRDISGRIGAGLHRNAQKNSGEGVPSKQPQSNLIRWDGRERATTGRQNKGS